MKMSRMMRPGGQAGHGDSTPICRCRVLYMGSAVPHITKDGLQGIQEPLRELYPEQGALGARGIDSWLSVWSNGLLLENVDENHKKVTRFFPIETLHYCAAVRYVLVAEKASNNPTTPRFLPLDSPFARAPNPNHPPLFAAILRRTTGIKVLECHAFICKREMAANALVRCCFHAYADSSYAKQIDDKTSEYGTIRADMETIDRVEGWRQQNTSKNGSTTSLNSHNGGPGHAGTLRSVDQMTIGDDMSVYNGDENHKVWAGLSASENIYDNNCTTATMTSSGKSSRPRQAMPPAPPPPPPPPVKMEKKKNKKETAKRKNKMGSREDMTLIGNEVPMRHAQSVNNLNTRGLASGQNGMRVPVGPPYSNGTLMRPAGLHGPMGPHGPHGPHGHLGPHGPHGPPGPHPIMYMPATATLPHPGAKTRIIQHAGTFSHRPKNQKKMPGHLIAVPPGGMVPYMGKKGSMNMPVYTMEEPIYMPSARALSPVASYQPGHFPHEAYLLQQYATMDTGKKKKGKKKNNTVAVPIPMPPVMHNGQGPLPPPPGAMHPMHPMHMPPMGPPVMDIPLSPIHNDMPENGTADEVTNGLTSGSPHDENDQESAFNTGIYRKKGHLNERAFSYSIRQEHRSRSYGSLANLKFASPGQSVSHGQPGPGGAPDDRQIMKMMHDLELSGDELERSEVPRAVYESKRLAAANMHR